MRLCILALAVLASACKGGGSTSPTLPDSGGVPPPAGSVTLTVKDGLTDAPVPGASVKFGTASVATDAGGQASFTGLSVGSVVSVSGAAGYRDHRTLFCQGVVTLWQNVSPPGVDDAVTKNLGYSNGGRDMMRPYSVGLIPSAEISADQNMMAALGDAVTYVLKTIGWKTPIVVGTPGSWSFQVRINPGSPTPAQTYGWGLPIDKAVVEFQSPTWARYLPIVIHEVTRTLGVTGLNPYPGGLLSGTLEAGVDSFTPAERDVLLLRYTRPVGALFAGDDDTVVPCAQR